MDQKIKVLFLDIDNTLLDFDAGAAWAMHLCFEKAGLKYRPEMFAVFKEENIILLVDEDGKLKDKKFNFEIYHGGIAKTTFVGNVIFAGIDKSGKWVGLNEKQIDFIYEKFSKEY